MRKIAVIIFALLFFQCQSLIDWISDESDECDNPDYSDCNTVEPYKDFLNVSLTINSENPTVEIKVFEGDYENNFIVAEIDADQEKEQVEVNVDQSYTVTARYIQGIDTIIAIDKTKLKKKDRSHCDSTCWSLKGGDIDVKLLSK
ncbi:MAG: hypothetical protein GY756_20420 [bacterium]|nr:hypothetical protein [bacterium]